MNIDIKTLSAIIKLCRKNGIAKLKCGEIDIEFSEPKLAKIRKVSDKKMANLEKEAVSEAEVKLKETQIENLLLEDPAEYERLVLQGELDAENDNRETESTVQ